MVRQAGHLLAKLIPGARKAIVPGGSHVFFTEHAPEASEVIRGFLGDVEMEATDVGS